MKQFYLFATILMVFSMLSVNSTFAGGEILIGAPVPLTGDYATDGVEMKEGIELAVSEINAAGGLLGRKVKVIFGDVSDMSGENVKSVGERMLGAGVNAVVSGYCATDTTPVTLFGATNIPYIDAAIRDDFAELVAKNRKKYNNIFQASYVASAWGDNTYKNLFAIPAKGGWKASNNKSSSDSLGSSCIFSSC